MEKLSFLIFLIPILGLLSCECTVEDDLSFVRTDPFFVDTVIIESSGVNLEFNKPVDPTTFKLDETVFFKDYDASFSSGSLYISWFTESRCFIYGVFPLCDNFGNCKPVMLTIKGEGEPSKILLSSMGQTLDGDMDGSDGGDFVKELEY